MKIQLDITHDDKMLLLDLLGGVEAFNSHEPQTIHPGIEIEFQGIAAKKGLFSGYSESEIVFNLAMGVIGGATWDAMKFLAQYIFEKLKGKAKKIEINGTETELDYDKIGEQIQKEVKQIEKN